MDRSPQSPSIVPKEALDIIEGEDFPGQAAEKGRYLLDGLQAALGDHPHVGGGGLFPDPPTVGQVNAVDVSVVGPEQHAVAGDGGCQADGSLGGSFNSLFVLDGTGSAQQSFPLPGLPAGLEINLQGVVGQAAGSPSPLRTEARSTAFRGLSPLLLTWTAW